jgi:16S rRNA A1518/A1519 N6-dimethyltransferase RsmA/KsgA/DIM1 with predicted DNA glycosylase/AP lyase activity
LGGVKPVHLRRVVTTAFQQRRKTLRNSLRKLAKDICGGDIEKVSNLFNKTSKYQISSTDADDSFFATPDLPDDWASKRPEELSSRQFVEVTRIFFGPEDRSIDTSISFEPKVWRKLKHGSE